MTKAPAKGPWHPAWPHPPSQRWVRQAPHYSLQGVTSGSDPLRCQACDDLHAWGLCWPLGWRRQGGAGPTGARVLDWADSDLVPWPTAPVPIEPQICQATCAVMKLSFDEEYRRAMNELGECPLASPARFPPTAAQGFWASFSPGQASEDRGMAGKPRAKARGPTQYTESELSATFQSCRFQSIATSHVKVMETCKKERPRAKNLIHVLSFTPVVTKRDTASHLAGGQTLKAQSRSHRGPQLGCGARGNSTCYGQHTPPESSLPSREFTLWLGLHRKVQKIKEDSNQPE